MGMFDFLSVIIYIINVHCGAFGKTEYYSPICTNRDYPKALLLSFERMKPKPWNVQIRNDNGGIEPSQNVT